MYSFYPDVQIQFHADIKPVWSLYDVTVHIWTRDDITLAEMSAFTWPERKSFTTRVWTKRNPQDRYNFRTVLKEIREQIAAQITDIHERSAFRNGFNKEVRRVLPSVRI